MYDPYGDGTGSITLDIETNTGIVQVYKIDDETLLPISDVTFKLVNESGVVVGNATTGDDGIATFSKLYQGTYTLVETSTNEDYILNTEEFSLSVEYNQTTEVTVENEHKKGNIQVYKVDKDNNKVVLGNVEFELYSYEFDKIIGTYYTDVNGEIYIENVRTGEYALIETETNRWYNLAEDTEIEVEWNETTETTIENELKKGSIKIIKVDEENNEIKLENVKFIVMDEDGNILEELITDENGEAQTSEYAVRDYESLQIQEVETLDTYVLDDTVYTIELEENQITTITFENERIKGNVEITKVDSNDETKTLEGATFGLYDENNNLIETLVTDENGQAISSDLYKGTYYLKEIDTGSIYYLLNENTFEFEIVNNGETIEMTIENEPVDITVNVDKTGTIEIEPGEDVNYTFSNIANNSNIYLDSFKWYDYIPTDYIRLQSMTTGTWNQDLTYSVYYKTNLSDEYVLFMDNLNTTEDYTLDFTVLELQEDEYITETCFDFGTVDVGFRETTSPTMTCTTLDTLQESDTFTNYTKTVGTYYGITAESNSKWTTIVNIPEETHEETLPRTGK